MFSFSWHSEVTLLITTGGFKFYGRVIGRVFGPACVYGQTIYTAKQIQGGSPHTEEGQSHQVQTNHNISGHYTHTFSPNVVNQFRVGWLKPEANIVGSPASRPIESLGVTGIAQWLPDAAFPNISFANGFDSIGGANNVPTLAPAPSWEMSDGLSITRGARGGAVLARWCRWTDRIMTGWKGEGRARHKGVGCNRS